MIPVLYKADATSFATFGIGTLAETMSCIVTEERNGSFECVLKYPSTGFLYKEIKKDRIIKAKPNDTKAPQAFRIYKISTPIDGIITVYAQHISYDLAAVGVMPFGLLSATPTQVMEEVARRSLQEHPFTFQSEYTEAKDFILIEPKSVRACLGGESRSLLSRWGGEFEWDNFKMIHHISRGTDAGVVIEYGKNLTKFDHETDNSSIYTTLLPYAVKRNEDETEEVITLPEQTIPILESELLTPKTLVFDMTDKFDDEEEVTVESLRKKAKDYIKTHPLGVDFEEENIHSMSNDGELMLSILASYAQEESRSVSENMKWRIKKNFEEGKPWDCTLLGYRAINGKFYVVPEEAEVIKRIYQEYLEGKGAQAISNELNEEHCITRMGGLWGHSSVLRILRNYTYTGNLLLQKTYRPDHILKKCTTNKGEKPMYHAENTHEAIIDIKTFMAVQEELEKRSKHCKPVTGEKYIFTSKIVCAICGRHYRRRKTKAGPAWICTTFNTRGKKYCASKQIPESILLDISKDIDFDNLTDITAENGNRLTYRFKDNRTVVRVWQDRLHSDYWTDEKKALARQRTLEVLERKRNG